MNWKQWYVYIMTNQKNGTLYTWVTSDLVKRVRQHKNDIYAWFTSKYWCHSLVYYEDYYSINDAIMREKQIKSGNRRNKIQLIESCNKDRKDLSTDRDMTVL